MVTPGFQLATHSLENAQKLMNQNKHKTLVITPTTRFHGCEGVGLEPTTSELEQHRDGKAAFEIMSVCLVFLKGKDILIT